MMNKGNGPSDRDALVRKLDHARRMFDKTAKAYGRSSGDRMTARLSSDSACQKRCSDALNDFDAKASA